VEQPRLAGAPEDHHLAGPSDQHVAGEHDAVDAAWDALEERHDPHLVAVCSKELDGLRPILVGADPAQILRPTMEALAVVAGPHGAEPEVQPSGGRWSVVDRADEGRGAR